MARSSRGERPGSIHHVVPQGNGRRRIVEDDRDRLAYTTRYSEVSRKLGWLTHASCLMDTHHHAVVETVEPNLAVGMQRLQGGHARWLNARHGREGSVFKQHFWSRCITDEGWFFRACLYVVLNPVAAGLCRHPREWKWCSYRITAEGDQQRYARGERRLLEMFGDSPRDARRNYAKLIDLMAAQLSAQRLRAGAELWRSLDDVITSSEALGVRRPRVSD